MRVSSSSLGSQSWVGCDQGHTGGVGGDGRRIGVWVELLVEAKEDNNWGD